MWTRAHTSVAQRQAAVREGIRLRGNRERCRGIMVFSFGFSFGVSIFFGGFTFLAILFFFSFFCSFFMLFLFPFSFPYVFPLLLIFYT